MPDAFFSAIARVVSTAELAAGLIQIAWPQPAELQQNIHQVHHYNYNDNHTAYRQQQGAAGLEAMAFVSCCLHHHGMLVLRINGFCTKRLVELVRIKFFEIPENYLV